MTLKETAQQVLQLLKQGSYEVDGATVSFSDAQQASVEGTQLYTPDRLTDLRSQDCPTRRPTVSVIDGTTQVVAKSMSDSVSDRDNHIALLNFASARNPGGGFLNGAKAQEEDLCRCSGLYPCLLQCMNYYDANRKQDSLLYTDYMIFSPHVPFFKTRGTGELLAKPFLVSVITAPAPNSGPFLRSNPGQSELLRATFVRRWQNVLCLANEQGVNHLLLGAWGCGAFGGDPTVASQTAREAVNSHGCELDKIVFAIPNKGRQSKANLEAFRQTFDLTRT